MAEGILKKMLKNSGNKSVNVGSFGIYDFSGYPASENAVAICRDNSIVISGHISKVLKRKNVKDTDLFLCMEESHKEFILKHFSGVRKKVFTLKEYNQEKKEVRNTDIDDPVGGDMKVFIETFREIESEIKRIFPYLSKNG